MTTPRTDDEGLGEDKSPVVATDRPAKPKPGLARNAGEWVAIVAVALLAAFLIKQYLVQAFYIPSGSMEDTLEISDRVLVNKLSYRLHDVNRGDVVVFKRPPAEPEAGTKDLIKRVVGLPGETVEGRNGSVYVDGRRLREPYVLGSAVSNPFGPQRVPPGHVWVMGDNRPNSRDSRSFGSVSESLIVGRAFIRVWPVAGIKLL